MLCVRIESKVVQSIIDTIGNAPIESGGILGMKDNIICAFYFDDISMGVIDEYVPNVSKLNMIISKWHDEGIEFAGIIHSHANGYNAPSNDDLVYFHKLLTVNKCLRFIFCPIVTKDNGRIAISNYIFDGSIEKTTIEVILP